MIQFVGFVGFVEFFGVGTQVGKMAGTDRQILPVTVVA